MSAISNAGNRTDVPAATMPGRDAIENLRQGIEGQVLVPEDEGFVAASSGWSVLTQHRPYVVVMAKSTTDIVRAVQFARDHELPVGVLTTGHGTPVACTDGVLINTSQLRGVDIDPEQRTARVEAGAQWKDVVPLAHQHGLAPLNGSGSNIGVVGYSLGGGSGWMVRKFGRASERIRAAEVVTANGELLQVTSTSHGDLLDALKGGGGNFGVVTSLEFELLPVTEVYGGFAVYPLATASDVFRAFRDWTATLPEDITTSISIMRFPDLPAFPPMLRGAATVIVRAGATGDLAAGEQVIAPMRAIGTPILDTFHRMPITETDAIGGDPVDPLPVISRTLMLENLTDDLIDDLLSVVGAGIESPITLVQIRHFDEGFAGQAVGIAPSPGAAAGLEVALAGWTSALQPYATGRVTLNFLGDGDVGEERTRAAYTPERFAQLQAVKAKYDPNNMFRFNHNIRPGD